MTKIGPNDPCPCGAGKKYKKCHGRSAFPQPLATPPPIRPLKWSIQPISSAALPPALLKRLVQEEQQEKQRVSRFGRVRPEIATNFRGHKFVAVGPKLYYGQNWKFFVDFLMDYLLLVLGRPWFDSEMKKLPGARHPILEWRKKAVDYMRNHQQSPPGGTNKVMPNGFLAGYLALSYDVYTIEHNARLDERVLERIRHPEQFQGARHELFAEATCLRADFTIEHEDEGDPTRRHAEFTATHRPTGQRISVEAKSRHRPGVLGQSGTPQAENELSVRFGKLLRDAVAKKPPYPLVVFLDTNLPYDAAARLFAFQQTSPPIPPKQILTMLDRLQKDYQGRDPANLVVFTNHPAPLC